MPAIQESVAEAQPAAAAGVNFSSVPQGELPEGQGLTWLTFLITLTVYAMTVYPSGSGGDAGELLVTACNLGTAHPPGYPTFSMLGNAFIRLLSPLGGHKAWRVNMMSSVFGAGAAAFVQRSVLLLCGSGWAGLAAGLGFAFNPTVWLYSIQGEVFGLNNLLVAWVTLLAVKYFRTVGRASQPKPDPDANAAVLRAALWGAFACGIAMTNQHTTVFYVLPTTVLVLIPLARLRLLTLRSIGQLTACVFAGMLPYLYLPISAHFKVMDSWGDQRTVSGFLHHFLRREYGTFQLAADQTNDPGMISRLATYFRILLSESLYVTPLLALLGASALLLSRNTAVRRTGHLLLANYTVYMLVFHYLANLDLSPLFLGVQARFWQQPNMYVYLCAGVGLASLVQQCYGHGIHAAPRQSSGSRKGKAKDGKGQGAVLALFCIAYALAQGAAHFRANNHRGNYSFFVNGATALHAFPQDSIVLLNGDLNNNAFKYPHQCEGVRRDVRLVSMQLMTWDWFVPMQADNYPNVTFPGVRYHPYVKGGFSLRQFLDANYASFSLFLCGPFKEGDSSHVGHYEEVPFGICSRLVKTRDFKAAVAISQQNKQRQQRGRKEKDAAFNLTETLRMGLKALPKTRELGEWDETKYEEETWEHIVFHDAWKRLVFSASHAAFYSNKRPDDTALLRVAKDYMDEIFDTGVEAYLRRYGILRAHDYRGAGIIYGIWAKHQLQVADSLRHTDPSAAVHAEEEAARCDRRMLRLWTEFGKLEPSDTELAQFVQQRINPYTGRQIPA